jgi:hypothetical protein
LKGLLENPKRVEPLHVQKKKERVSASTRQREPTD